VLVAILSFISFSLFGTASPVYACSCIPPSSPQESLASARAVFMGTVTSIEHNSNGYEVSFNVEKTWKGISGSTVTITTPRDSAACGFAFTAGEKYIVYADGEENLSTSICSRTHLLAENDPDLLALGDGIVLPPQGSDVPTGTPNVSAETPHGTSTPLYIFLALLVLGIIYRITRFYKKSA